MQKICADVYIFHSSIFVALKNTDNSKLGRINILLRAIIAVVCCFYLYRELFVHHKFSQVWQQFISIELNTRSMLLLSLAALLVFVNWGIESAKWRLLLAKIEKVSAYTAFESVISGITISIFTPNRIGEFAARIFYLESNHRVRGILASIIGSVSQLCVTVVTGSFSFVFFLIRHQQFNSLEKAISLILAFLISTSVILFYYNMDVLRTLMIKIRRARKMRIYLNVFSFYRTSELNRIMMLSIIRYLVFSLQYFLLLRFFNINLPVAESFIIISGIFFVLAIIPTIALTELGIRGYTALYFLEPYSANSLGIIAASYGLWLINLVLPAMLGLLFLPKLKFFRKG
jgi:hypothetical protein